MPLTALEIYKHLPKKNCGECGVPTCLAFAMQLASLKAQIEKCPYISKEAKDFLASASAPPIKLVKIGIGENEIAIGDEVVLFRHEKTFYNKTAFSLLIDDNLSKEEIEKKVEEVNNLKIERVGQILKIQCIALKASTKENFENSIKVIQGKTSLPLILISEVPENIESALKLCSSNKPLIYCANSSNYEKMSKLAKEFKCPLVVKAESLEELSNLTEKIKALGIDDLVLDFGNKSLGETLRNLTIMRRLAIKKSFRPFGYPIIVFAKDEMMASLCVLKYGSIVVMEDIKMAKMLPLLVLRQNIYTDPQKPIQVKPGLYEILKPNENSPLLVTTNFSLTFFTVSGDTENSKVPSWLMVVDSEGLSVLTAFAAGKFTAELIAKNIEESGIKQMVKHNKIIIPGMVARMSGKLKELTSFEVVVGPRESSGLPAFLREYIKG